MSPKSRNLAFVFLGVAVLVFRDRYAGPFPEAVHSYGGNIAVSFALFFVFSIGASQYKFGAWWAAAAAFLAVQFFEAFDGFGIMQNTYDPVDFAANTLGIGLAAGLDYLLMRRDTRFGRGSR